MHSKGMAHTGCMRLLLAQQPPVYNKLCEEQEFTLKRKYSQYRQKSVEDAYYYH